VLLGAREAAALVVDREHRPHRLPERESEREREREREREPLKSR
jgi:hypothetical protein